MQYLKYVAKAIATALVIILTFLTTVLTGHQTLADVTQVQWLLCALLVLGGFGFTYAIPNGPRPAQGRSEGV